MVAESMGLKSVPAPCSFGRQAAEPIHLKDFSSVFQCSSQEDRRIIQSEE